MRFGHCRNRCSRKFEACCSMFGSLLCRFISDHICKKKLSGSLMSKVFIITSISSEPKIPRFNFKAKVLGVTPIRLAISFLEIWCFAISPIRSSVIINRSSLLSQVTFKATWIILRQNNPFKLFFISLAKKMLLLGRFMLLYKISELHRRWAVCLLKARAPA